MMAIVTATTFSLAILKIVKNFKNKLMVLITMELMFILTILSCLQSKANLYPFKILMTLTVFMVLDSTMGISILMSTSRNSYSTMQQFKNI